MFLVDHDRCFAKGWHGLSRPASIGFWVFAFADGSAHIFSRITGVR